MVKQILLVYWTTEYYIFSWSSTYGESNQHKETTCDLKLLILTIFSFYNKQDKIKKNKKKSLKNERTKRV